MACSVDAALGRDRTSASARGAAAGPGTAIRTAISASSKKLSSTLRSLSTYQVDSFTTLGRTPYFIL